MPREIPIKYDDIKAGMEVKIVQHFGATVLTTVGLVTKVEVKSKDEYDVRHIDFQGMPRVEWPIEALLKTTAVECFVLKPDLPTTPGSVVKIGTRAAYLDDDQTWCWTSDPEMFVPSSQLADAEVLHVVGVLS